MKLILTIALSVLMLAACKKSEAGPAQARIVSKEVGPLLREAQALIVAKNYKAALVKVNEAEAVKSTPDDTAVLNQYKILIAASSQQSQP